MQTSDSGIISLPKSLQIQHWHLRHPINIPNHEDAVKFTKTSPNLNGDPKICQKYEKINNWIPRYLLGVPGHSLTTKWYQNGVPGVSKWTPQASKMTGLDIQNPTSPTNLPVLPFTS